VRLELSTVEIRGGLSRGGSRGLVWRRRSYGKKDKHSFDEYLWPAMASLAGMRRCEAIAYGSEESGVSALSDVIAGMGITCVNHMPRKTWTPRTPDWWLWGNASRGATVGVGARVDKRITFTSMAAVLHDEFLPGRESLVVAGNAGARPTTTSMCRGYTRSLRGTRTALAPSF